MNGDELGEGYRSRHLAYPPCDECRVADGGNLHSHRRSRQSAVHGSIAPPLVIGVHTMLSGRCSSGVKYEIVSGAEPPQITESVYYSDSDSESGEAHELLPDEDFCGMNAGKSK